jgi:glycosyltransferase involved in cell wall biosynthesis
MKVSICIPTYNQAAYIELAVRSAFQQSLKPFEIIIFDDHSTDQTPEILDKLSKEIPIVKHVRQSSNLGIARNVDSCLRYASGDYIIRLDSDDQLSPFYTEKLLKLLMEFPQAGYAHAAIQEIDQSGNFLKERRLFRKTGFIPAESALKEALKGYRVTANILMFKRQALVAVNFLNGLPNFGEDYYLTSFISAAGFGNIYLDEVLGFYRVWVDAAKVRQKRKLAEINGIKRVFEEVLEPAFNNHGWNLTNVKQSRKNYAIRQADCLGWDIYTSNEKKELNNELLKLSSAPIVKLYAWMYKKKLGSIFHLYKKIKSKSRSLIKQAVLKNSTYKNK